MPKANQASQTIDQLQKRYQNLSEKKIKVETQRDHALTQLNELKAQAKELYGSDDVEELKKILEEMKTSNETKRSEYQESLDSIDAELAAVDEKFNEDEDE
jgi:uncharacterized coiled-coil DUF342 family protein